MKKSFVFGLSLAALMAGLAGGALADNTSKTSRNSGTGASLRVQEEPVREPTQEVTPEEPAKLTFTKLKYGPSDTPVTDCDKLAADPGDPQKAADGVFFRDINGEEAVAACRAALEKFPKESRFAYQLGRALDRQGDYPEALEYYLKGHELGSLWGTYNAALMYRDGVGTAQDHTEANRLLKFGAEHGDPNAMNSLGYQYDMGQGVPEDDVEAVRYYRAAADLGLGLGLNNLGVMYRDGNGVKQDYKEAVRLFRLAADKDEMLAYRNLGFLYRDGNGVDKDEAESVRYFRLAADKGDVDSLVKIAFAYLNGRGVKQDDDEALRYYRMAADKDNSDGMAGVGYMYAYGRSVAKDPGQAAEWIAKSLEAGSDYSFTQMTEHSDDWEVGLRRALQNLLKAKSLYKGPVNGTFDEETIAAIKKLAKRT